MTQQLTAQDYEGVYNLPDHWIMHERDKNGIYTRLHSYYINRVTEIIKGSGAKSVLEVGCGDGWASGQMAQAGLDVVGIDWSSNAIGYASIRAPKARFMVADARDAQFVARFPNKFDALALIEVIEHIPPDECVAAMRNISSHLKPGGVFVLTTPSLNVPNHNPQHYRHFNEEILRNLVRDTGGLEVSSIEGYGNITALNKHYRIARWLNNRLYEIKPAHQWLLHKFHRNTKLGPTPFSDCYGFIMTMRRTQ